MKLTQREAAKKQNLDKTSSYSVSSIPTASQHILHFAQVNSNQTCDHLQIKTVLCNSSPSTRTDQTSNCYRQVENLWTKVPDGLACQQQKSWKTTRLIFFFPFSFFLTSEQTRLRQGQSAKAAKWQRWDHNAGTNLPSCLIPTLGTFSDPGLHSHIPQLRLALSVNYFLKTNNSNQLQQSWFL